MRVTVVGYVQTPPGPEINARGRGLIVILVVVVAVHPLALTTLNVTGYVPGRE